MSLETKKTKTIIKYTIYGLIILLLAIFFGKVAIWENSYYKEKEGSARATTIDNIKKESDTSREKIIEEEPTEEEVEAIATTLPSEYPAYITISGINQIGRSVIPVGTNSDKSLATPNNVYQIGWYTSSGHPGGGLTGVYDGHNGGPNVYGVLKELPILCPEGEVGERTVPGEENLGSQYCEGIADTIEIETAGHDSYSYKIVENITVPLSEANEYMKKAFTTPVSGKESITIITCTGEWSDLQQTYLSRQFTRAVLIQ